jgi:hypothetical protein
MFDRLNGTASSETFENWVEPTTDRRSGNTACGHTTGRGACRTLARWQCRSCKRITCARHILWQDARPVCSACEQSLMPLMQRKGERRQGAQLSNRTRRPSSPLTGNGQSEGVTGIGRSLNIL